MKNNSNTLMDITQVYARNEDVKTITEKLGYKDTARKFTVYQLLCFLIIAAADEWKSYREGVCLAPAFGLPVLDHSTVAKKAKSVPYEVFKELFYLILSNLNHKTRRKLGLKKSIIAVDSTTISVGENRLVWAGFHGKKAAIKLHVGYDVSSNLPIKVVETIARKHDGPVGEAFEDHDVILVEDRAYANISRFDRFIDENQSFVVRIKKSFSLVQSRSLRSFRVEDSIIRKDFTCYLGKGKNQSKNRIRVVIFNDESGNELRIATDMMNCPPELIADLYKERWAIEQFFRFIKQNLNISRLYGTSKNAVFSQMYCALIAYILIEFMHEKVITKHPRLRISRIQFLRQLITSNFKPEVYTSIYTFLNKRMFCSGKI